MKLHVREYGSGEPVIILHGLFGCGDNWHTMARAMAECCHVIVPDQRNHGRSPHSNEFSHALLAEDLEHLLDRFALGTTALLGHSMGGKTAMHFALTRPGRVSKLIVADIAPRPYRVSHSDVFRALGSIAPDQCHRREDVDRALAKYFPDASVRAFLLKNLKRSSSGHLAWRVNVASLESNHERILEGQDTLGSFVGSTLFVRGQVSDYITPTDAGDIITLFPKARIVTIPNAGHWIHADAPTHFATTVIDFLRLP